MKKGGSEWVYKVTGRMEPEYDKTGWIRVIGFNIAGRIKLGYKEPGRLPIRIQ